ncbi:heme-binding protein [Nocardia beijingensis]|uniref:heme-binding protein n=1 Tax=Nocardia beijingensis TaxID=95162 RepID=UPI0018930879|nr:heme-binding protein [Nocardia beijingensis]MBF6468083.1 heme-binding protein [Nocardia beijingensis]
MPAAATGRLRESQLAVRGISRWPLTALFHRDGSELARLQQAWPALFSQMDQVGGIPVIADAGARLIRRGDAVVGAIAVSGGSPEHDDECAEAGITALSAARAVR